MRWVIEAVIALSPLPLGFTASELAGRVRALIGKTRRYESMPKGLRAMTALVVLRNKAIKPLPAAAQDLRPSGGAQNPRALDTHYDTIRTAMRGIFKELGLAAGISRCLATRLTSLGSY